MSLGTTVLLVVCVLVALGFDFTNGFHDTANAVATTVGTRAMSPRAAVGLSAALNLVGAVVATQLLHTKVANTVGGLVKPPGGVSVGMVIAALVAAIIWNLLTWRAGLPSSSSHALIGGLIGMGIGGYGLTVVKFGKLGPVVIGLLTSPIIGLVAAYVLMLVLLNVLRRMLPSSANRRFRRLQVLSAIFVSFSHGANDAQKTMAIITLALLSTGHLAPGKHGGFPDIPFWVVLVAAAAIGLGTYAGGWRIIRTMGTRIIRLEPIDGFSAQTMAAVVIAGATQLGLPVSTTHVVTGAVMGAGSSRRPGAVRWGIARNILVAWVLTIPATMIIAGGLALAIRFL
ncbi:MAG: anion permease [Candidatus Dormibacteria bacterium]